MFWCSLKTLCTSVSCLKFVCCPYLCFCSQPLSSSVTSVSVCALSLPQMQRLSVRTQKPLGPFDPFLIKVVVKVSSLGFPTGHRTKVDQQTKPKGMWFAQD
jgi:hypothetical protein